MQRPNEDPLYLLTDDDAYRIEGLISTLAMAVWEILRRGKMQPQPDLEDDATVAQDTFLAETRRLIGRDEP